MKNSLKLKNFNYNKKFEHYKLNKKIKIKVCVKRVYFI